MEAPDHKFTISWDNFPTDLENVLDYDFENIVREAVTDKALDINDYSLDNEEFWEGLYKFLWATMQNEIKTIIGFDEREVEEASGLWLCLDFSLTDPQYNEMKSIIEGEIWEFVSYYSGAY